MRDILATRISMLAAIVALAAPVSSPAWSAERVSGSRAANARGCWYYGEANFQGARAEIVEGASLGSLGEVWNDKISSLTCHPLCTLVAFEHVEQGGTQKKFTGDVRFVGDAWNDKISSMSVSCRRRVRSVG